MYLFNDLYNKYPEFKDRLAEAERFFTRLFDKETMEKVFTVEKRNSKLFYIAYDALRADKSTKLFNQCMAYYEQWLSYDEDALKVLVADNIDKLYSQEEYNLHKEKFFEKVNKFLKDYENGN